mmetsp:Transcript_4594/g.8028  ORF Transcript_4594/g.8028 Transcript_4594/m.8028 type:complete len:192 (-) Transcript_4594:1234-1809(-)
MDTSINTYPLRILSTNTETNETSNHERLLTQSAGNMTSRELNKELMSSQSHSQSQIVQPPPKQYIFAGSGWGYGLGCSIGGFLGTGVGLGFPSGVLLGAGTGIGAVCGVGFGSGLLFGTGNAYLIFGFNQSVFFAPKVLWAEKLMDQFISKRFRNKTQFINPFKHIFKNFQKSNKTPTRTPMPDSQTLEFK